MNNPERHVKARFFILGVLTGIVISGLFSLIFHNQFSRETSKAISSLSTLDYSDKTPDEFSIEGKININQATVEDLIALPGIGSAKAQAIISYRDKYGPFLEMAELMYVPGIGESQLLSIKPYITIPGGEDE